MKLTEEQKKELGILDERVDFYFKMENDIVDRAEELGINAYEGWLVTILARYCNNNKVAFPSLNTLCKKMGCSKPTLLKTIESLVNKKLIKKVNRSKNGVKETNLYSLQNINNTLKNIQKNDLEVVKEIDYRGKGGLLGVVKEIDYRGKGGLHKEEQTKKNKVKKNKLRTSSYNYSSLESLKEFKGITKSNISKNLETTNELIESNAKYILEHKDDFTDIDKVLYSSLKKGIRYNASNAAIAKEVEAEELKKDTNVNLEVLRKLGLGTEEEKETTDLRCQIIEKYKKINNNNLNIVVLRSLNLELKSKGLEIYEVRN